MKRQKINTSIRKKTSLLLGILVLLLAANAGGTQLKPLPAKRLRSPALVRGFIGGESHDNYVIRVRKGRILTVRLSWRHEDDNRASFKVSESPDYYTGEPVKFGLDSDNGNRWTGKVPKSGDYYIDVVAHPTAHYTLKVTVK